MSELGIVLFALGGFVLGSFAWIVANIQAGRWRPMSDANREGQAAGGPGWLRALKLTADPASTSSTRFLPLMSVAAAVFMAVYLGLLASRRDSVSELLTVAAFAVPLLVILLVDWWTRVIYTNWIAVGTVLALGIAALDGLRSFLDALGGLATGAAVFGGFYILALLLYRDVRVVSLGAGDVLLAAMIGAMTGDFLTAVGTLFYGILLAALGAGLLLLTRRGSQRKALPSGAYLCVGAFIGLALRVW